jgi:hypothetical protein
MISPRTPQTRFGCTQSASQVLLLPSGIKSRSPPTPSSAAVVACSGRPPSSVERRKLSGSRPGMTAQAAPSTARANSAVSCEGSSRRGTPAPSVRGTGPSERAAAGHRHIEAPWLVNSGHGASINSDGRARGRLSGQADVVAQ